MTQTKAISKLRAVDDDEQEAVSGGADRDWIKDGCSASMEEHSRCGSDDKCIWIDVTYSNYDHCPKGGNHEWKKYSLNLAPIRLLTQQGSVTGQASFHNP